MEHQDGAISGLDTSFSSGNSTTDRSGVVDIDTDAAAEDVDGDAAAAARSSVGVSPNNDDDDEVDSNDSPFSAKVKDCVQDVPYLGMDLVKHSSLALEKVAQRCNKNINSDKTDVIVTTASQAQEKITVPDVATNLNTPSPYCSLDSGPVFPVRHNREMQPSSNSDDSQNNCSETLISSSSANGTVHTIDNATRKVLMSYIDTGNKANADKMSNIEEESQDPPSSQKDTGRDIDNFKANVFDKELPKSDCAETESLAPLNASFFNCQYQTPSWIDDPLIGVPPSAMENKNTHRKTGADMRILTAYMRSLSEMRLPEAIPPTELDKYLSSFFLVVRKADGSEYEPCSLRAMLASIERYLRFKNYPLSLTRDAAFSNMRNVLKLKQQTLRSIGKGQKGPSEVSPSSLAREGKIANLFKSQEMGPYTPSSVVFTLCFYFCMYLRIRKSTENKKLLWGDIVLCKDESGREFLTFSSQMLRRAQGSKTSARQRNYRVWADPSCPEKDPVTIFKFYAQKRPASMNTNFAPFYLGINVLYPTQGQLWYRPAAMGINKLNEMVRQIRDITGIRSAADSQNDTKSTDKQLTEPNGVKRETDSPSGEFGDQQDFDNDGKSEAMDDIEDGDSSPGMAIDFSQDQQEQPLNLNSSFDTEHLPPPSHPSLAALSSMAQAAAYSDAESDDSISHHSFPLKSNGESNIDPRTDMEHENDLAQAFTPDSPLNCSTKGRSSFSKDIRGHQNSSGEYLFLS